MSKKTNIDCNITSKGKLSSLRYLKKYLSPYKLYIIGAILALILTSSSVLAIGKGLGFLIDYGLSSNNPNILNKSLIIIFAVIIVLALATYARFYLISIVGEFVVSDIRKDIYRHLIGLSPEFFETNKAGDILSRATTDTELIQIVVGSSLSIALRNFLMLVGGFILLIHTSPKLTLIVVIIVPFVVAPIIFFGRKLKNLSKKSQSRLSQINSHTEETIYGIKTIQAFVKEEYEIEVFKEIINKTLITAKERITIRSLLTAIVIISVFCAVGFVLWIGGHDVLSGNMTAGKLSSFIFYSIIVAGATGAISEVVGNLNRAAGATERIIDFLQTINTITESHVTKEFENDIKGNILIDNITFYYPGHLENPALKNLTLEVKNSETLALVGPSGAGKSTLFEIILRFYNIQHGSIIIDGINIKDLKLSTLRNLFATVPQEPIIFSGTVYDNIIFGNPKASKEDVYMAAEAAAATEFVMQLPNKYDSFLGEKGVRLSGGQKQRIAIARAFLKNPKILLLDEATSALDTKNEKLVQKALENLMKDRTTIVIAHRLSTIQKSDKIAVINNGSIVEIGTHKELIKNKDLYHSLVKSQ